MAAMALLLGVVCGWLGRMVIDKLGGHGLGWVVGYEAWIFTQIFAVWCVCPLHELLQAKDTGGAMQHLKLPCYMLATGLLAPVAVAACPFWANWANFW